MRKDIRDSTVEVFKISGGSHHTNEGLRRFMSTWYAVCVMSTIVNICIQANQTKHYTL